MLRRLHLGRKLALVFDVLRQSELLTVRLVSFRFRESKIWRIFYVSEPHHLSLP